MTVPTPAIAPYVPTYATYTPYVSPLEFKTANTGVDVSQLVPGGDAPTQAAALLDLLARASSEADRICQKPLAATTDVVSGEYLIRPDGTVRVPVPYKPIVAVVSVSIGYTPNSLTPMADLSGIVIGPKVLRIPITGVARGVVFPRAPAAYATPGKIFVLVTYVNGWAHTELTDAVLAGAATITPASVVGLVPGLPVMVKDGSATEPAVVGADYVYGSATVPLASPLANAHDAGTTVSALPPFVKNAVIDLGKALAKAQGSKGIVMGAINGQTVTRTAPKEQPTGPGGAGDMARAEKALEFLRRSA